MYATASNFTIFYLCFLIIILTKIIYFEKLNIFRAKGGSHENFRNIKIRITIYLRYKVIFQTVRYC